VASDVTSPLAAERTRPLTLGRATDLLESLKLQIDRQCPLLTGVVIAGDARRFEPLVFAPVIVAVADEPAAAPGELQRIDGVRVVRLSAESSVHVLWQGAEIELRIVPPDRYGSVLFAATGHPRHTQTIHDHIGRDYAAGSELELYRAAGLPFIVPELRQNTGEIEAAAAGRLPSLIERTDIRGDLHMHTNYSDGQDTIDDMLAACVRAGYEYIAITDHSELAAASRTLSRDSLSRQREDVERLRLQYPQIGILHGVETEILPNGRLDFDDGVLETLDIVLASLHDAAGHDPETLTARCLEAIRHPLVNVITHPANQLVGRRGGYPLDFDALYAAAGETGTALEIDGAPSHLDLDGEHARAAVLAGVTVTIDSDCHRADALERQMQFGLGTARRGGVQKTDVLNARPLHEVRAFIDAKRSSR
jgi:DNA polymerase (family 10)